MRPSASGAGEGFGRGSELPMWIWDSYQRAERGATYKARPNWGESLLKAAFARHASVSRRIVAPLPGNRPQPPSFSV